MFRPVFRSRGVLGICRSVHPLRRGIATAKSTGNGAKKPLQAGLGTYATLAAFGLVTLGVLSLDSRSGLNEYVWVPLLRTFTDAEQGHEIGIFCLKNGIYPRALGDTDDPALQVKAFGKTIASPVGMAAGFDKQGEAMDALFSLGFGTVEIGTVTARPQQGNPKPRFFRLSPDEAVINRYGLNSEGSLEVLSRLRVRYEKFLENGAAAMAKTNAFVPNKLLFVNIGKNRDGGVEDYITGVDAFAPYADALVLNVSCPNAPGCKDFQQKEPLQDLLVKVKAERDSAPTLVVDSDRRAPILVKVSPDLDESEIKGVAEACKAAKVDGIIMSNTTLQRPASLITGPSVTDEKGGLSGPPLKPIALKAFRTLRKYTKDSDLVLIGCGGISSGKDAIEFAKAGATLVEMHTAIAYKGPGLAGKVKDEIAQELKKEGKTWMEIVGSDDN